MKTFMRYLNYKTFITAFLAVSSSLLTLRAQNLLYGTTIDGGQYSYGTIFSYNPITGMQSVLYNFTGGNDGGNPDCDLLLASDSLLYGIAAVGGVYGFGVIFNFNPKTNQENVIYSFSGGDGIPTALSGLSQGKDGLLYGSAYSGDINSSGDLFNFNIQSSQYTILYSFDTTNKSPGNPTFSMVQNPSSGLFYGTTQKGGNTGFDGTLYKFDTTSNTITVLYNSDTSSGPFDMGDGLLQISDSLLYGMSGAGGSNRDEEGTIYKFNTLTGKLTVLYSFTGIDEMPTSQDKLILASNGLMYGMTVTGGTYNDGILFSFDPATNTETTLVNFDGTNGKSPDGSVTQDPDNGLLYGVTRLGGANGVGVLFSYNITTSTFTKLVDFSGTNGSVAGTKLTLCKAPPCGNGFNASVTVLSNPSCSQFTNGSAAASLSGGIAPYSYLWAPVGLTSDTATGLSAGSYTLLVYDSGGTCSAVSQFTVAGPKALSASITVNQIINCYGGNNGSLTANPIEGAPPFTFSWSNASPAMTINSLTAGTYSVTISDSCGSSATATVTLNQSASALNLTAVVTANINCSGNNNGSASATANGGTSPYTFLWSNNEKTASISNLTAGNYTVTVTDNAGCILTASVDITEPSVLTASVTVSRQISCNDNGSLTVNAGGGTTPYAFKWSNNETSAVITNLSGGNYSITVTDANGCTIATSDSLAPYSSPAPPALCYVTVDTTSQYNVVVWQKVGMDTNAIDSVLVLREVIANVFIRVGAVSVHGHTEFTDVTSNPNVSSYFYTLGMVTDSCGNGDTSANLNKTIFLQSTVGFGNVDLNWNDYLGQTVSYYRILKDSLGNGNWEILDSVPFGITSYTDHHPGMSNNLRYLINTVWKVSCMPSITEPLRTHRASHYLLRVNDESYSNINVVIFTGINQSSVDSHQWSVYPNPTKDELFISFPQPVEGTLILSDMLGRLVYKGTISGDNTIETISTEAIADGVYMLTFNSGGQRFVKKVMKIN